MMYEEKAILVADEQVYVYVVRSVRSAVLDPTLSASCFKKHVYFWREHNRFIVCSLECGVC